MKSWITVLKWYFVVPYLHCSLFSFLCLYVCSYSLLFSILSPVSSLSLLAYSSLLSFSPPSPSPILSLSSFSYSSPSFYLITCSSYLPLFLSLSLPFSTIPLPSVASPHTCRTGAFLLSGSSHPAPGMTFVQSHSVDPRYLDEMPTRTVSWHAKSVLLWFLVVPGQVWNYTNQDKQRFTSFGYLYNTPDS